MMLTGLVLFVLGVGTLILFMVLREDQISYGFGMSLLLLGGISVALGALLMLLSVAQIAWKYMP